MSASISGQGQSPEPPPNGNHVLVGRIQATQSVSEMTSQQAAKLLGHAHQLEAALDQLSGQIEPFPEPGQVDRLAVRMDSLQAMLDWLTTRVSRLPTQETGHDGNGTDLSGLQARMSMTRVVLISLQSEIREATGMARDLGLIREDVARLASDLETLTSVKDKAQTLANEAKALADEIDHTPDSSADIDDPNGEVLPRPQAQEPPGSN